MPRPEPSDLPESSTSVQVVTSLAVDIARDGAVSVDGKPIEPDGATLIRVARDALARDPEVRAIIRADRSADWGSVVRVVDLLRQASLSKIAFAVSVEAR